MLARFLAIGSLLVASTAYAESTYISRVVAKYGPKNGPMSCHGFEARMPYVANELVQMQCKRYCAIVRNSTTVCECVVNITCGAK